MKSNLGRRPSPALVISCIALFLSLGGVSYGLATGSIDSREIKNNAIRSKDVRNNTMRTFDIRNNEVRGFDIRNSTIQGRDVALNTLTGADISEKDLGQVPSAATAANATTVGGIGVKKVFMKQASGAGTQAIFNGGFFTLSASCAGGTAALQLNGVAGAPETNAAWQSISGGGGGASFANDTDLEPGAADNLLGAGSPGIATVTVSTTDGRVATVVIAAESAPAFGESVCAFRGTVISG